MWKLCSPLFQNEFSRLGRRPCPSAFFFSLLWLASYSSLFVLMVSLSRLIVYIVCLIWMKVCLIYRVLQALPHQVTSSFFCVCWSLYDFEIQFQGLTMPRSFLLLLTHAIFFLHSIEFCFLFRFVLFSVCVNEWLIITPNFNCQRFQEKDVSWSIGF